MKVTEETHVQHSQMTLHQCSIDLLRQTQCQKQISKYIFSENLDLIPIFKNYSIDIIGFMTYQPLRIVTSYQWVFFVFLDY